MLGQKEEGAGEGINNGELLHYENEFDLDPLQDASTRVLLPYTMSKMSSTIPQNKASISEEIRVCDIEVIPSSTNPSTEQCNVPQCAQTSLMDFLLKNMVLISNKKSSMHTEDSIVSSLIDVWAITKLIIPHTHRRPSVDNSLPNTELVNQMTTGRSELFETSSVDGNINRSEIQEIDIADSVNNNKENESILTKFTKWLTTSDIKSTVCDRIKEDATMNLTRKAFHRWTEFKILNIKGKEINMMAPSSF